MKLFESIEKQNLYNEKKIIVSASAKQSSATFSVAKSYLQNLILKSMATYHSGSSIDIELSEHITHIEFLYNKRLFKQCLKLISKAKKKAREYDTTVHLLGFLWWQRLIYNEIAFLGKTEEDIIKLNREEVLLIEKLKNSRRIESLFSEFYYQFTLQGIARNEEDAEKYYRLMNYPLLEHIDKALTFDAKNSFYNIHSYYYKAINDPEKQYVFDKKRVELIEDDSKFIQIYIHTYLAALQNLISSTNQLRKDEEFHENVNKLISLDLKSEHLKIKVFGFVNNILMKSYSRSGDFIKSLPFLQQLEEGLEKYKDKIDLQSQAIFNYNIAYFYFAIGQHTKSLSRINMVINISGSDLRHEIQSLARVMNLLLHYELKNDLIGYIIKSTIRFLSKSNKLYKMENHILDYIRKSTHLNSKSEILKSFKVLKKELEIIVQDPMEKSMLENLDIISWLDSKINKISFEQAFKKNI
ncbi:MAG TPA: hypothetical protein VFF35_02270 [Bacteroidia bacterium]|nr:hypothetical protein [Bacteroidia bacterium]